MKREAITLAEAIELYLEHETASGLAAGTLELRLLFLKRIKATADAIVREKSGGRKKAALTSDLCPQHISRFLAELTGGAGHWNNALTAVRSFARFLERSNYIRQGGEAWLSAERKQRSYSRKPKAYLGKEDFAGLLDIAGKRSARDRMVMAMAVYTLCRAGEISGVQLRNVNLADRTIMIYREKTDRYTESPITPDLYEELGNWLREYAVLTGCRSAAAMMDEHPGWWLCPTLAARVQHPVTRQFIHGASAPLPGVRSERLWTVANRAMDALGIKHEIGEGIHTIRRSGARLLLDHLGVELGHDKALLRVSIMLDHTNPLVTLKYIGMDIERQQAHEWARANSLYGNLGARPESNVVQLRAAR